MKKTKQTIMTAAMFAVAMNMIPTGTANALNLSPEQNNVSEISLQNGNNNSKKATESDVTTSVYDPTEYVPVGVYGPPIAWKGDIYPDGQIDVYDLIRMRQLYVEKENRTISEWEEELADVNGDGEFGIADIVMLQRYLQGQISNFDDIIEQPVYGPPAWLETTAVSSSNTQTVTTATVTEPIPQPVYGPAWISEK